MADAPVVASPDETATIAKFKQQLSCVIVLLAIFGPGAAVLEVAFAFLRLVAVLACTQIVFTLVGMPEFLEQAVTLQAFIDFANGIIGAVIFMMAAPAKLLLAVGRRFGLHAWD